MGWMIAVIVVIAFKLWAEVKASKRLEWKKLDLDNSRHIREREEDERTAAALLPEAARDLRKELERLEAINYGALQTEYAPELAELYRRIIVASMSFASLERAIKGARLS